jgi:glycerophosphoryl diester phosphodiesterase
MTFMKTPLSLTTAISCTLLALCAPLAGKTIVAHRGASGYLPEHTLAAKTLAYAQGSDYLEQDAVLTKDGHAIVIHDIYLEGTTDVAAIFPGRARKDGHYYAIDFTLDEIRQLSAHERVNAKGEAVFASRFGPGGPRFEVHTLEEEIEFIQRLNRETGRDVGIYVEIKKPAFHTREGQDITRIVFEILRTHGYAGRDSKCWIQCFDSAALKRLRMEFQCEVRLTQLIGQSGPDEDSQDDYAAMRTANGLKEVAHYANAIGPSLSQVLETDEKGQYRATSLTQSAHTEGLEVVPYTLRRDSLPAAMTESMLLTLLFEEAGVDGVFTDFADSSVAFCREKFADR